MSSVTQMLIDLKWWDLAQRQIDVRLSLMYKIVHSLILIEAIKYVNVHKNFIKLQQILARRIIMRCHSYLIQSNTGIPTKNPTRHAQPYGLQGWVVSLEHHLPYYIPFITICCLLNLFKKCLSTKCIRLL